MAPGQSVTVNMGSAHSVKQITVDAGNNTDDPAGYQISLSTDGVNWGSPVATGPGTGPLLVVHFPAVNAKYIKVVQTGSSSSWWSITEFNAYS
jgi:beta-glucosidase